MPTADTITVDAYIDQVKKRMFYLWGTVRQVKGWNLTFLYRAVMDVVVYIESLTRGGSVDASQKRYIAVRVLTELVDNPILPGSYEGLIYGLFVDAVVTALNRVMLHDWYDRIAVKDVPIESALGEVEAAAAAAEDLALFKASGLGVDGPEGDAKGAPVPTGEGLTPVREHGETQ